MDVEDGEQTSTVEQLFLSAVERGDVHAVKYALKHQNLLNTSISDVSSGQDAMQIALENGHIEIVKVLLYNYICVNDSLLRAVDLQFYKAVEIICNFSKTLLKRKDLDIINSRSDNEDFHPVITPIILAAHHNDYDVIKLLLSYGATLEDPETTTDDVTEKYTLQHSLGTLLIYKALASEAFITLTAIDPINRAFVLCEKLRNLGEREVEFSDEFTGLEKQCEMFAAELLAQARTSDETTTILTYNPKEWSTTGKVNVDSPHKCFQAVMFKQKKFMAHPYCQQFLIERWYRGLADWREMGMLMQILISNLIMLFCPLLSLVYILCPHEKIAKFFRIAYVKFLMHTGSSLIFILLIFISLYRIEDLVAGGQSLTSITRLEIAVIRDSTRGRTPTVIEFIMLSWILGMTWREVKQVWNEGFKKYMTDSWNMMDFLSLSLYWMSYTLMLISWLRWRKVYEELDANDESARGRRLVDDGIGDSFANNTVLQLQRYIDSAVREILHNTTTIHSEQLQQLLDGLIGKIDSLTDDSGANDLLTDTDTVASILSKYQQNDNTIVESRLHWDSFDPDLVVEALFSLANILTVLRLINIVIISKQVGPLQISLWGMFNDIFKFLAIFSFVLMAFTIGITQLYKFYSTLKIIDCINLTGENSCNQRGFTSFGDTFRALFWNLFGYVNLDDLETNANHVFTEGIGEFAFAMYHILGIIILLNALIAMMSNTYTRIEENSDMEWKFSRAQLWLSYIENGNTAPPPFNVIPSVKTVYRFLVQLKYMLCPRLRRKRMTKRKNEIEKLENKYETICQRLVVRYWAEKRSSAKEGEKSVTHADILRIKQDISSLRYDFLSNQRKTEKSIDEVGSTAQQTLARMIGIETTLDECLALQAVNHAEVNVSDSTGTVDVDVHAEDVEGGVQDGVVKGVIQDVEGEGVIRNGEAEIAESGNGTSLIPETPVADPERAAVDPQPATEPVREPGPQHDFIPATDADLGSESESDSDVENVPDSPDRKTDRYGYPHWFSRFK